MTTELDNVTVVTGTNLPMLVELVMTRAFGDPTLYELAERARVVGREGVDLKKLESADIDEDDEM